MDMMTIITTLNGVVVSVDGVELPTSTDVKPRPKIKNYFRELRRGILKREYMWNIVATTTIHDRNGNENIMYTLTRYDIS